MQQSKVRSVLQALKSCCASRDLQKGKIIHAAAKESGEDVANILIGNSLVNMYAKCGSLADAQRAFDHLHSRDVVSWNSLILGYADNGEPHTALETFTRMREVCDPNARTFVAAIKACSILAELEESQQLQEGGRFIKAQALERGTEIHNLIREGGSELDVFVPNALVDFYSRCGCMADARSVFDRMPSHSVVSWTSLLMGYVEDEQPEIAGEFFDVMINEEGCEPDTRTFVAALKACTANAEKGESTEVEGKRLRLRSLAEGMRIHSLAIRFRCGSHIFVSSSLVDCYSKCGSLVDARKVFDTMEYWNIVSWTSLILGCLENGEDQLALELVSSMEARGFQPDSRVFAAAFKACSNLAMKEQKSLRIKMLETGRELHLQARKLGCDEDLYVKNTLVEFYARTGSIEEAVKIFDSMQARNVVSWNSLMLELVETGDSEGALTLFRKLTSAKAGLKNYRANGLSFVAALKACGALACLRSGKGIHSEACKLGVEDEPGVQACLVDFYAKCGSMVEAQVVFDAGDCRRSLGTWNSLLAGYSRQGSIKPVLETFRRMVEEGVKLEGISLVCVLNAYSHSGNVEAGKKLLREMSGRYGVAPGIDHYNCVIDALGRANRLGEAVKLVETMCDKADRVSWRSVLGACVKWKNVECGRLVFERLVSLGETENSTFVLMQNLCASQASGESELQSIRI